MYENTNRTFICVQSASEQQTINTTSYPAASLGSGASADKSSQRAMDGSPNVARSKLDREREKVQRQRQKKHGQQMMPIQINEDRQWSGRSRTSTPTPRARSAERESRAAKPGQPPRGEKRRVSLGNVTSLYYSQPKSIYEMPLPNQRQVNVLNIGGSSGYSKDYDDSDEESDSDGTSPAPFANNKLSTSRSMERLPRPERGPIMSRNHDNHTLGVPTGERTRGKPSRKDEVDNGQKSATRENKKHGGRGGSKNASPQQNSKRPGSESDQPRGPDANQLRVPDPARTKQGLLGSMYADTSDSEDQDEQVQPFTSSAPPSPSKGAGHMKGRSSSDEEPEGLDSMELPDDPKMADQPMINIENLEEFVFKPVPQNTLFRCRISRDKKGVDRGMFPTYFLHLERADSRGVFLLAGRKRRKSSTSNYLMSCDPTDLSREGDSFVGKVRSNFIGTQFTIYDNGSSSKRDKAARRELAAVVYEKNLLGLRGPRKMSVIIPGMTMEHEAVEHRPKNESETLLECFKHKRMDNLITLRNKTPVWNAETQSYVLNFHGRVKQASVKNFQIVHESNEDYIVMQFGRVNNDVFNMDIAYPLCPLQAFGIALSSFDGKLACE